jgi:hypothetical protein
MLQARYLTFPDVRLRIVGSFLTEFTAQGGKLNDLMGLAGNLIDCMIYEISVPIQSLSREKQKHNQSISK